MLQRFRGFTLIFLVALHLMASASYAAEGASDLPPPPMPANTAELDALLDAKEWNRLAAVLKEAQSDPLSLAASLNWLRAKLFRGGGFLVAYSYMRDLYIAGITWKTDDLEKDLRVSAGEMALYAYALILIDGAKCEDISAPSNRAHQLITLNPLTLSFAKGLPGELKAKIVDIAIGLETRTAPLRGEDDMLCRSGIEEYKAAAAGGTSQEVPNTDGHVGRTFNVAPPPDWKPKLVGPEIYLRRQDEARKVLRERLLGLIQ